jgi:hypothetical protein
MNPSSKTSKRGFVADDSSAEIVEPTMCSLDFEASTISATSASVLSGRLLSAFSMRANQFDAAIIEQSFAKRVTIRRTVINKMFGNVMWNLKPIQRWLNQLHFVVISPRHVDGERSSVRIDNVDDLGPLATFGFANSVSPLLARANQASAAASDQSILPRSCNSCRSSNQRLSKMPIRVHSSNRRQQVLGEGKHFGNFDHWQPVISTYRIPSKHVRDEWNGRPPRGCSSCAGIMCAMRSHCESVRYVYPASSIFRVAGMSKTPFAQTGTQFPCQYPL